MTPRKIHLTLAAAVLALAGTAAVNGGSAGTRKAGGEALEFLVLPLEDAPIGAPTTSAVPKAKIMTKPAASAKNLQSAPRTGARGTAPTLRKK